MKLTTGQKKLILLIISKLHLLRSDCQVLLVTEIDYYNFYYKKKDWKYEGLYNIYTIKFFFDFILVLLVLEILALNLNFEKSDFFLTVVMWSSKTKKRKMELLLIILN